MPDARVIPHRRRRPRRAGPRPRTRWPRVRPAPPASGPAAAAGSPLLDGTPPPVEAAAPARPARRRTAKKAAPPPATPPPAAGRDRARRAARPARPAADAPVLPEWERKVAGALAFVRRRLTGDVEVDEFGFDPELTDQVLLALLRPLYEHYFRVEVRGLENVPADGGALVVANHSGTDPARLADDPDRAARPPPGAPAPADARRRPGVPDAGHQRAGAQERHHAGLQRRRRAAAAARASWSVSGPRASRASASRSPSATSCSGSAGAASCRRRCEAGVPIVPCSIVGAEEIYPILGNMKSLARLLGLPYVPVTPTFPWLGPLGVIPLPSKWIIEFGEPIAHRRLRARPGRRPDARLQPHRPGARDDPAHALPAADARRSVFF